MVTKIPVCLEVGYGGSGAFAPDYPGCWVFGRTSERALAKVKGTIAEWFKWVERHGERAPSEMKNFEIEVAEMMKVNYNPVKAGKPEPLFWSEVASVSRKDIARTIRLLEYSREDLLKLVSNLSKECLEGRLLTNHAQ